MVAISLYRGNLHRVSDVQRRWPLPKHRLSLKHFKLLRRKRNAALSRLHRPPPPPLNLLNTQDNHHNQHHHHQQQQQQQPQQQQQSQQQQLHQLIPNLSPTSSPIYDIAIDHKPSIHSKPDLTTTTDDDYDDRKPIAGLNLKAPSGKEKRKEELEKNLRVLNAKKHQLVQALKQIINAEEEIKKRNSIQMLGGRAAIPLQMEATFDTGSSVTRHAILKINSDGNISGDQEGESDDISNPNNSTHHMHHMQITSPSAISPLRRPAHSPFQHNMAPQTGRVGFIATGHTQNQSNTMMGVIASPSRFAPGHQGHVATVPPVSVSGAHFIASSPSPAASGGTSAFRDAR